MNWTDPSQQEQGTDFTSSHLLLLILDVNTQQNYLSSEDELKDRHVVCSPSVVSWCYETPRYESADDEQNLQDKEAIVFTETEVR